ncbi:CPBP family intramembrane metalloprotease [Rickettsia peacockii]|uniref:CPBP family intramembrane metalloprotease n=1 Tax=Rickettsia peacockii TaxID=47589 RepID=UPI0011B7D477
MLAVIIASLIFGITYFQGRIYSFKHYMRFFLWLCILKTDKILCSVIVHFGLNLCHVLLFTYPALKTL